MNTRFIKLFTVLYSSPVVHFFSDRLWSLYLVEVEHKTPSPVILSSHYRTNCSVSLFTNHKLTPSPVYDTLNTFDQFDMKFFHLRWHMFNTELLGLKNFYFNWGSDRQKDESSKNYSVVFFITLLWDVRRFYIRPPTVMALNGGEGTFIMVTPFSFPLLGQNIVDNLRVIRFYTVG